MARTKELTQEHYNKIRDHLFDRIFTTGEEIKNDFPNRLRYAIEKEAWKQFAKADGKPFENVVDWLKYIWPNGTSLGGVRHAINYDDAVQLTKEVAPDVHRVLLENAPKAMSPKEAGTLGGKGRKASESSRQLIERRHNGCKSAMTLSVRLAQEYPKYYEAYMRGDYKSVTGAATAAGILKGDINLRRAKSAYRKMTGEERKEFLKWIRSVQ